MTSMNLVDQYHDPALDVLIGQNNRPRRTISTQKKGPSQPYRSSSEGYNENTNGRPSSGYEPKQGSPITYRGAGGITNPGMHRSFSQRAKGRPFADEAFADDDLADPQVQDESDQRPETPPAGDRSRQQEPAQAQHGTRRSARESHVEASAPVRTASSTSAHRGERRIPSTKESVTQPSPLESGTPFYRAATLKDAANQTDEQRQDWAPDRSPLQKLEVKLTDISKEEKRARVQEAEMRLMRDRSLTNKSNQPQTDDRLTEVAKKGMQSKQTQSRREVPSVAMSPRTHHEGSSRRASNSDRPTTQQSTVNRASKIDGGGTDNKRQSSSQEHKTASSDSRTPTANSRSMRNATADDSNESRSHTRSVSGRQPLTDRTIIDASQPRPVRATSLQHSRQQTRPGATDEPLSQRERNASHQAALEQLTGEGPYDRAKTGPRKLQKDPPRRSRGVEDHSRARDLSPIPIDLSTAGGDSRVDFPQQGTAREVEVRRPQTQTQRDQQGVGLGLGLQQPLATRSVDSPPVGLTDIGKQRQRKSSVSFKEPFDRRRPGDEWKTADTARLVLDDFSGEQIEAPGSNKAWWEQNKGRSRGSSQARATTGSAQLGQQIDDRTAQFSPRLYIKCGPLLRYTGLKRTKGENSSDASTKEYWRGSVMIVTQDSLCSYEDTPTLRLFSRPTRLLPPPPARIAPDQLAPEYVDPIAGLVKLGRDGRARYVRPIDHLDEERDLSLVEDDNGIYEASPTSSDANGSRPGMAAANNRRTLDNDGERLGRYKEVKGVRIYADPDRDVTFWRFNIEIELGLEQQHIAYRINKGASVGFWVPRKGQTMNMMFHTCNGFSMSVNTDQFSGPDPLWRDVLNNHQTRPFHVMIGGGDQIYNDRVMMETQHFAEWTSIKNPHHKHQAQFTHEMKEELETFYLERYCMWFSQGLFAMANASIPMVNIWDDHDIIDGFGSYPHEFMRTPVFSGLGNVAHKYYLLFQHQSIDSMTEKEEPSWLLGHHAGPYIQARSRSLYLELGQSVGFLGIDCRTERTKNDVLSIDTLEVILDRCRREMVEGQTKHLIVLLGVPIAYPRLVWLENVLTSRAMDPIKALGRAGILKTKMLNKFDGGVEILDDLDDHWTATHHKDERNILIQELQDLAAEKSARITILGGDVHLAAIGQFYSNPKLKIPKDRDHRYMPNVISSAIVNTPPPEFMADVMNKRNKVHHLDKYTDENMIPMFTHDVDQKKRNNTHLLPRRNWCSIREYTPGETPPPSPTSTANMSDDSVSLPAEKEEDWYLEHPPQRRASLTKADFNPRNLMRRLSSRNQAPPTSFRGNTDPDRPQPPRAHSFDGNGTVSHSADSTSHRPQIQNRSSSADHVNEHPNSARPTFHRRPTNLSEKAAKKGNVLAVDAEGNEFDVNDHVNLECGLDISINCEVNQKDPAGITTPYRILVPALWYDGSSDREKITENAPIKRRNTVLHRFGIGSRRGHNAADNQGAGNWGQQMSETESYDGSDRMESEKPHRSFSLFGSRRKKKDQPLGHNTESSPQQHVSQPQFRDHDGNVPTDSSSRNKLTRPRSYDHLDDSEAQLAHGTGPETAPGQVMSSSPLQQPRSQSRPQHPHQLRQTSDFADDRRPASYTIGSGTSRAAQSDALQHQPYDADAAYLQQQSRPTPSSQTQHYDRHDYQNPHQQDLPARQASQSSWLSRQFSTKQERVLGIGSAADSGFQRNVSQNRHQQPPHTQLRGNGIIGKNYAPPPSYSNGSQNGNHGHGNDETNSEEPRGYSGIEAYKEPKSKRRWSLSIRDKARGLIDSVEGKRKSGGYGRDQGNEELYSDEEDEEDWEGDDRDHRDAPAPVPAQRRRF